MSGQMRQSDRWSALLMAGGESRRMGRDKATLVIAGEELWRRQVRTLRKAGFAEIMIARGEREPLGVGEPGLIVLPDAREGCGPLGALAAGLQRVSTGWLLVLAVDLPLMPAAFLRPMMELAGESGRGVVPQIDGRFEPLVAVYPGTCLEWSEDCLAGGQWSMRKLVQLCMRDKLLRSLKVRDNERGYFRNVNTPEDLADVERQLARSSRAETEPRCALRVPHR
jgi:molybdopterin-guanine dinucleotide biosynthesis protein A